MTINNLYNNQCINNPCKIYIIILKKSLSYYTNYNEISINRFHWHKTRINQNWIFKIWKKKFKYSKIPFICIIHINYEIIYEIFFIIKYFLSWTMNFEKIKLMKINEINENSLKH